MDSSSVSKTEDSGSYPDPPAIQDPNRCENCQTVLKFYSCKSACLGCGSIMGCSEGI